MSPSSSGFFFFPQFDMHHLGRVPLALQASNPQCRGLMNLLCVHKQRTNKPRRKHLLPWVFNCLRPVSQSMPLAQVLFLPPALLPTRELLAALGNRSLLRFLGITDACWVTSSAGSVSFPFHSASVRTFVRILRRVTYKTMSQASSGCPSRVSLVIESGLLLPTEKGVSVLSLLVYRVIKSLHTNTCQLWSALTKTGYLIPPAVHLQPTL